MNIQAFTINITYERTTRPITFIELDNYNSLSDRQITAIVLYNFKDLIPNYQKYCNMRVFFDIRKAKQGTLILPELEFKFNIETLGHGSIEIIIDNSKCDSMYYTNQLISKIEKELGISSKCIELCDEDGIKLHDYMNNYDSKKSTLYAVVNNYEDEVIKEGYEIIEYKSKFTEGGTMNYEVIKEIGNYKIVKFSSSYNVNILKRTPKMVKLIYSNLDTTSKKIQECCLGEIVDGGQIMLDERYMNDKEYAIAC